MCREGQARAGNLKTECHVEGVMSLPDYLLDDEDDFCDGCGMPFNDTGTLCMDCRADTCDMYADEKIQDRLEGSQK